MSYEHNHENKTPTCNVYFNPILIVRTVIQYRKEIFIDFQYTFKHEAILLGTTDDIIKLFVLFLML